MGETCSSQETHFDLCSGLNAKQGTLGGTFGQSRKVRVMKGLG